MKKVISMFLILILALGMASFSFAEEYIPEDTNDYSHELELIDGTPKLARWKYTSSTIQGCFVDGSGYTGNASVTGYSNVTKVIYVSTKKIWGWMDKLDNIPRY